MTNNTTTYEVHAHGTYMGDFSGETAQEAVDAYARAMGYADFSDLVDTTTDEKSPDSDFVFLAVRPWMSVASTIAAVILREKA